MLPAGPARPVTLTVMSPSPSVSVVIPALAADTALDRAIQSVRNQDYTGEIDITIALPEHELQRSRDIQRSSSVRVVLNPDGRTPTGLNTAIAASSGEIVVRCDAHSRLAPDYVSRAVEALSRTGAWNVGGIQRPSTAGARWVGRAIAVAQSTPLGVGDARYRLGGDAGPVDTVYLGVFPRHVLERLGGYADLDRNQDYELNIRIRQAGGVVWFDPSLVVDYTPRQSLGSLARQYFDYGRWKHRVIRRHPRTVRLRQLAAPGLVVALLGSAVLGAAGMPTAAMVVPAGYVTALLLTGAIEALKRKDPAALAASLAIAVMHMAWGMGFLLPQRMISR